MKKAILLISAALMLALYMMLQPPQPQEASTPPPTSAKPQSTSSSTQQKTSTTSTPPPTATPTQSPIQNPRQLNKTEVRLPRIVWRLEAPAAINTTRLPTLVNYTLVVTNSGNATGYVEIDGKIYAVDPGASINISKALEVKSAGTYSIPVRVNGTVYMHTLSVLYYTARLIAEPLNITISRVPTAVEAEVAVRNAGNLTAYINGTAVPPGASAVLRIRLNVTTAGIYTLDYAGVPVIIHIKYAAPSLDYRVEGCGYVEALPGEKTSVRLYLINTGNATAHLAVDGETYQLPPGGGLNISKTVEVKTGGIYDVDFSLSGAINTTIRCQLKVAVIRLKAMYTIWEPVFRHGPLPWSEPIEVATKNVVIKWGYRITSNATTRKIKLVVADPQGGGTYELRPGETLSKNITTTAQAPADLELAIYINGTSYKLWIPVRLVEPYITVADVSQIKFVDTRPATFRVACRGYDVDVKVLRVEGQVEYGSGSTVFQGWITASVFGSTYSGTYSGVLSGNNGKAEIYIAGRRVEIYFTASPLAITKVLVDGTPSDCPIPTGLIPGVLYRGKPTARGITISTYAATLVDLFAKTSDDAAKRALWNGEYVEVADQLGRMMRVYIGDTIKIEGPLSAEITAVILR